MTIMMAEYLNLLATISIQKSTLILSGILIGGIGMAQMILYLFIGTKIPSAQVGSQVSNSRIIVKVVGLLLLPV
jgi:hypothetical protein